MKTNFVLQQLPFYAIGFKREHAINVLLVSQSWSHAELCRFSNNELANQLYNANITSPSQCAGVFTEIPGHLIDAEVVAQTTGGLYNLSRYYQITLGLTELDLRHSFHFYDIERNR